jgi:hypothetical protein
MNFRQFLVEYTHKNVDQFLKAWKSVTEPDPAFSDNPKIRLYKQVYFNLIPYRYSGTIHIEEVKAMKMGAGAGTQALTLLCKIADRYKVPLTLHPVQLRLDGPSKAKLIEYYGRFGFKPDGSEDHLRRDPNALTESVQDTLIRVHDFMDGLQEGVVRTKKYLLLQFMFPWAHGEFHIKDKVIKIAVDCNTEAEAVKLYTDLENIRKKKGAWFMFDYTHAMELFGFKNAIDDGALYSDNAHGEFLKSLVSNASIDSRLAPKISEFVVDRVPAGYKRITLNQFRQATYSGSRKK